MTPLGARDSVPQIQGGVTAENGTSGIGAVSSIQYSKNLIIENPSMMTKFSGATVDVKSAVGRAIAAAGRAIVELITRAWTRCLLLFKASASTAEELRNFKGLQENEIKQLEADLSLIKGTSFTGVEKLLALQDLVALHGCCFYECNKEGKKYIKKILSSAFKAMPSFLTDVIYARVSDVEKGADEVTLDFKEVRELIVKVYRNCPSIALNNLKRKLSEVTGDEEKCAIFLKMRSIQTSGLEPDLTGEMINEYLTRIMEGLSLSVQKLIENAPSLPPLPIEETNVNKRSEV